MDIQVEDPAWSPDGEYIAFSTYDREEHTSILLLNKNGTVTRLYSETVFVAHPAWSRDGNRLAVVSGNLDEQRILVIDRQGSLIVEAVDNLSGQLQDATFCDVVWTPDDNIIFSAHDTGIFLFDFESHSLQTLVQEELVCHLSVSDDGQWLAFNVQEFSFTNNRSGIYVMNLRDHSVARLTDGRNDAFPAWLP